MLSNWIEKWVFGLWDWPLDATQNSGKFVRVLGVLGFMVWWPTWGIVVFFVGGILGPISMIIEA